MSDSETAEILAIARLCDVSVHVRGTDSHPVVELRSMGRVVGGIELKKRFEQAMEYFLPFTALKGTRATPHRVYGSRVYSFKIDTESPRAIDGKRLRIRDGRIYADFENADGMEQYFPGCERVGNSFDLGKAGID